MNLSEQTLPSPIWLYDVNVQPLNVKKRRNEQKLTAKHKEAAERLQKLYDLEQSLIKLSHRCRKPIRISTKDRNSNFRSGKKRQPAKSRT